MKENRPSADDLKRMIRDALACIVEGREVKRVKHDLSFEGEDVRPMFMEELILGGYHPLTVKDVAVNPGERVPAFLLEESVAYFGWVFWEQFTSWKLRKLFGSVLKNGKGDWEIQIPATRPTIIYANPLLKIEMDIDHPPEF